MPNWWSATGCCSGFGGGIAFTLLQQAIQASIRPSGLVNGYVVGLYPLGAMIASRHRCSIAAHGLRVTLAGLGHHAGHRLIASRPAVAPVRGAHARCLAGGAGRALGQRATFLSSAVLLAAAAGSWCCPRAAGIVTGPTAVRRPALGAPFHRTHRRSASVAAAGGLFRATAGRRWSAPAVACRRWRSSLAGSRCRRCWGWR